MALETKPRTPGGPRGAVPQAPQYSAPARTRPAGPARPVTSPRHTRPAPVVRPPGTTTPDNQRPRRERQRSPERQGPPQRPGRQQRMPFILLLVGLLGGALVSLLVISTTLDAGAYRITNLTNQNASLTKQIQVLNQQVANAGNPGTIAQEAYQLGMRHDNTMRFLNPVTGKLSSSAPVRP
jgi:hypothetical protein